MLKLLKDGATVHMARGYADYVYSKELDYMRVVGDPLAAGHYREGHELAAHELGAMVTRVDTDRDLEGHETPVPSRRPRR